MARRVLNDREITAVIDALSQTRDRVPAPDIDSALHKLTELVGPNVKELVIFNGIEVPVINGGNRINPRRSRR